MFMIFMCMIRQPISGKVKEILLTAEDDLDYDDDYATITRINAAAFTMNGKGYITTGIASSSYRNNTWEYGSGN